MAKHHNLPTTKSSFKLVGQLTRLNEDKFYTEKLSSTGKTMLESYFAVKTSNDTTVYGIHLKDMQKDNVKYQLNEKVDGQVVSYPIPWDKRYDKREIERATSGAESSLQFAKYVSLNKDKDGKFVTESLTQYDVIKLMYDLKMKGELNDGSYVMVKGKFAPNTYVKKPHTPEETVVHSVQLEPSGIYGLNNPTPLDELTEEDKITNCQFSMDVVIKEFNEVDGQTYMTGIIVGYDSIEEMEFRFSSPGLANNFKTLSPYTMISCVGYMKTEKQEEKVEEKKAFWGSNEKLYETKNKGFSRLTYFIDGAYSDSIDSDTYNEANIEEAKKALMAFKMDYNAGKENTVTEEKPEHIEQPNETMGNTAKYDFKPEDFGNNDEFDEFE